MTFRGLTWGLILLFWDLAQLQCLLDSNLLSALQEIFSMD